MKKIDVSKAPRRSGASYLSSFDPPCRSRIHDRVRLGVMAHLAGSRGAGEFTELKARLAVSDGDLSVHPRKLEDAGYVAPTSPSLQTRQRK